MKDILSKLGIRVGDVVAIEGPPIYASDRVADVHRNGYAVVRKILESVSEHGATPRHYAMIDDMHGGTFLYEDDYKKLLEEVGVCPDELVPESSLCMDARGLIKKIPTNKLCGDGNGSQFAKLNVEPRPLLRRPDGTPACALLDAAFNVHKDAVLSVVVHPKCMQVHGDDVDFMNQQRGVMQTLRVASSWPFQHGILHVWINEKGDVLEVTRTFITKGGAMRSRSPRFFHL